MERAAGDGECGYSGTCVAGACQRPRHFDRVETPLYRFYSPRWPRVGEWGFGCDDGQCIWTSGDNLSAGGACQVFLYDAAWRFGTTPLGAGEAVTCSNELVTFRLPAAVYRGQRGVNFTVVNAQGQWTFPVLALWR